MDEARVFAGGSLCSRLFVEHDMTTFLAAKISVLVCEYSPHVTITTQRSSAMCAFVVRQPDPHRADVKVAIPHGPLLTPVVPTPTIDNQRLTLTHSIQTFFSLRRRPCRRHCWRRRCSIHAPSVVAVQRYRRIVVVVVVTTNHKLHCCTNAIVRSFVALDKKKTTTRREKVVSVCRCVGVSVADWIQAVLCSGQFACQFCQFRIFS